MSKLIEKYFIQIVISLVIIFYIIFKLTIGQIEVETTHTFKNPMYKLYINNSLKGLTMTTKEYTTIIPFTLYRTKLEVLVEGDMESHIDLEDNNVINITGYNCYTDNSLGNAKTKCLGYDENNNLEEIDNIVFDSMTIYNKILKGYDKKYIIYDGEYITDLSKVINEKGNYSFVIKLHHGKIKTIIEFFIVVE